MLRRSFTLALALSLTPLLGRTPLPVRAATNAPAPAAKMRPSCATCAAVSQAATGGGLDKLATLGRRTQPQPLIPLQRSTFEGVRFNLVSTSTGNLAFAVNDLELSGVMPILFQRVYDSSRRNSDNGLGVGWSFAFDDRITLGDDGGAILTTGNGSSISFRGDGRHFVISKDAPGPHQSLDLTGADTITEPSAGLTRVYQKIGASYRLARIADANGNAISISFDARGNLARMDNGSAAIALTWSADKSSRLLSVADSAGRGVAFKQDGQRLRSVTDAAGAQWAYDYEDNRLTAATDPLGRTLLRARYDRAGRAVESSDAAGSYGFDYDASPGTISRRTLVTDPAGAKLLVTHNENGAVTAAVDGEGQTTAVEYNSANRPTRIIDAAGNETKSTYDAVNQVSRQTSSDGTLDRTYSYDASGRLVSTTDGGVRTDYTFDARGNVISAQSSDAGQSYEVQRNARGQAIRLSAKGGRTVSLEYDAGGHETAIGYSDAGRFESEFDAAGQKVAQRLPSGLTIRSEYDTRGRLTRRSDSRGHSITITRDAGGAVSKLTSSSGRWVSAERDAAGRITALTNSSGKTRRFAYDGRGSLVGYTDARGDRIAFGYDSRGLLRTIDRGGGVSFRLAYDRAGRLVAARRVNQHDGFAQFLPASFSPLMPFARSLAQDDPSCLFGGDGWFEGDTFGSDFGMGCDDPFGGFGDGFGGDGWFWYDSSDACNMCKQRQKNICQFNFDAAYKKLIAADATATVGCAIATVGTLAIVCGAGALLVGVLMVSAINDEYNSCLLSIPDKCTQAGCQAT